MSIGLPTAALRIAELFADPYLFALPPYQRPYSWTLTEAGQLLEDVLQAAGVDDSGKAEPDCSFGTILLLSPTTEQTVPTTGEPRVFQIIDGQQRLVTLTMLACVLRDLQDDGSAGGRQDLDALIETSAKDADGRRYQHRLELRGRHQTFLKSCVLDPGACSEMPDITAPGEVEARILEIREHFIHELMGLDPAQRSELVGYLRNQCYFSVMLTDDIDRAHRTFLVLNFRGKHLSRHDILKAEVLSKVPADAADAAVTVWDELASRLDERQFEAFFSHMRTIHGQVRPQVITGIRAIIAEVGGTQVFLDTVFAPLAEAYGQVLNPGPVGAQGPALQIKQSLLYMHRLNGADWVPPAMAALLYDAKDPPRLASQLAEIERLAHLLRIMGVSSGKRARRFADVITVLRDGKLLSSAEAPCRLNRDERRTLAYHLRDLYDRSPQMCKPVLLRLNDEFSGTFNDIAPATLNVEHILPQRTGEKSPWRQWFADGRERDKAVESLGNLLLVTPKQNERARNLEFLRKREIYREADGGPLQPMLADVLAAEHWRAGEIAERESKMLQALDRIWRIGWTEEINQTQPDRDADPSTTKRRRSRAA